MRFKHKENIDKNHYVLGHEHKAMDLECYKAGAAKERDRGAAAEATVFYGIRGTRCLE